jgi:hypothetical protein
MSAKHVQLTDVYDRRFCCAANYASVNAASGFQLEILIKIQLLQNREHRQNVRMIRAHCSETFTAVIFKCL